MKKNNKILILLLPILIIVMFMIITITPNIMAEPLSTAFPNMGTPDSTVTGITDKIWGTALTIAQILAFAAILFVGIRYMFSSADRKADIKSGLIYLFIGAILVFAASTVVKIVVSSAKEVAPSKSLINNTYSIVKG